MDPDRIFDAPTPTQDEGETMPPTSIDLQQQNTIGELVATVKNLGDSMALIREELKEVKLKVSWLKDRVMFLMMLSGLGGAGVGSGLTALF